ncbi:MAG: urease subunit beta [Alphaproteobacteria bacterium]|jgi:urease subunit gamma/beta|nr:urease subunit beta [Alphaproteobacteria bacterium]
MAEKKWSPPPIPKSVIPKEAFDVGEPERCGQIDFAKGDIEINAGRPFEKIVLVNTGDRPIQIGAHYHLAECNRAMAFDRQAAFGMHLDIPSGTAIRFEPGQSRKVQITEFAGRQVAYGMNNMTNGTTRSEIIRDRTMRRLREEGYCFEGERFPISSPADKRFKGKKTSVSKKKS